MAQRFSVIAEIMLCARTWVLVVVPPSTSEVLACNKVSPLNNENPTLRSVPCVPKKLAYAIRGLGQPTKKKLANNLPSDCFSIMKVSLDVAYKDKSQQKKDIKCPMRKCLFLKHSKAA